MFHSAGFDYAREESFRWLESKSWHGATAGQSGRRRLYHGCESRRLGEDENQCRSLERRRQPASPWPARPEERSGKKCWVGLLGGGATQTRQRTRHPRLNGDQEVVSAWFQIQQLIFTEIVGGGNSCRIQLSGAALLA